MSQLERGEQKRAGLNEDNVNEKTDSNVEIELAHGLSTLPNSIDETTKTTISALSEAESNPFFIPNLTFTPSEESKVIRILDTRLFPWVLLTTFVLNMDRTNLSNAISDNLPKDLGFTTNTVNLGTAIYSVLFSLACLGGAVVCKIVHPARCEFNFTLGCGRFNANLSFVGIPFSMFCWGLVTMSHALIRDKGGYLTGKAFVSLFTPLNLNLSPLMSVRCSELPLPSLVLSLLLTYLLSIHVVIAVTEGGVIPATLIYLGSFYRSTELATRLAWFWGVQTIASAVSGLMASGLLQLQGVSGLEGWKWLFLVDGIITVVVAVLTWYVSGFLDSRVGTNRI